MECTICGGLVEWKGPLANPSHTECKNCGARNSQVKEQDETCEHCFEKTENCICIMEPCSVCKKEQPVGKMYEYRRVLACEGCIEEARKNRDHERAEVIEDNRNRTECFRGLDLGDSSIGKANRQILKQQREVAGKESGREKSYRK